MTNQPRNRVVVFRLSQEEYQSLKDASERRSARNLSDFTRSEVLSYLQADTYGKLDSRITDVEQKVADLQTQVDRLQGVNYVSKSQA